MSIILLGGKTAAFTAGITEFTPTGDILPFFAFGPTGPIEAELAGKLPQGELELMCRQGNVGHDRALAVDDCGDVSLAARAARGTLAEIRAGNGGDGNFRHFYFSSYVGHLGKARWAPTASITVPVRHPRRGIDQSLTSEGPGTKSAPG